MLPTQFRRRFDGFASTAADKSRVRMTKEANSLHCPSDI
jgi:hypothetical protein